MHEIQEELGFPLCLWRALLCVQELCLGWRAPGTYPQAVRGHFALFPGSTVTKGKLRARKDTCQPGGNCSISKAHFFFFFFTYLRTQSYKCPWLHTKDRTSAWWLWPISPLWHTHPLSEEPGSWKTWGGKRNEAERSLSKFFNQAQTSFECGLLCYWLGEQGLGGLCVVSMSSIPFSHSQHRFQESRFALKEKGISPRQ